MIAGINRWVLLAVLAAGQTAMGPLQAPAGSLDWIEESAGFALTDALIPYAQRDYGRALALLTPLADQGNAVAQLKLGIIFSGGKAGSPDHVAALRWFTKAAEQGQVDAQFELGRIYRDVLGRVNAHLAQEADAALLMVAGLPIEVKELAARWRERAAHLWEPEGN